MKIANLNYSDSSDSFRNKTLKDYKNDYSNLLDYYKKLSEDNDEINFVNSEIRQVNEYITPVIESQKTELELRGILDLNNFMIKKRLSSYLKIISFLEAKKSELETVSKIRKAEHNNIFSNNGFELFNYILEEYVKPTKGRQADLIFYHRKMYDNKPQYIHQKPTEFFNWFGNNYNEVFGQLKTLSQVETTQRNKDFSNALNWFRQQPQQVP